MKHKENRKHLRVPVDWPVVILDGTGAYNARLIDISANGAFVVSDIQLQPRKQLTLFIIPDNHRTIRAMSESKSQVLTVKPLRMRLQKPSRLRKRLYQRKLEEHYWHI